MRILVTSKGMPSKLAAAKTAVKRMPQRARRKLLMRILLLVLDFVGMTKGIARR